MDINPYFMHYFVGATSNAYTPNVTFNIFYRKLIEYCTAGLSVNMNDQSLPSSTSQCDQSFTITVSERIGHPIANLHDMWIGGISDPVTILTTCHGLYTMHRCLP